MKYTCWISIGEAMSHYYLKKYLLYFFKKSTCLRSSFIISCYKMKYQYVVKIRPPKKKKKKRIQTDAKRKEKGFITFVAVQQKEQESFFS
jgi:hypothetical protein